MSTLRNDPVMAKLMDEHGPLELTPADDPFRRLVTSIVNQQLSTQSAAAIRGRFFDRYEITPEGVLAADEDGMRETGLSRQKVEYLKNAAQQFIDDDLTSDAFAEMSDEDVIEELTDIHGVGVWTAKMFLIFVLAREDVFPVEDLGIRRGMTALYGLEDRQAMREKAAEWEPHRSRASLYVWKHQD